MQAYKHSGIVPIGGALMAIVAGAVAALVGGILYAYIIAKCPLIYFCVLATLGFGALIGGAIALAFQIGKIRNNSLRHLLTFVFATIGIYCEWGATSKALGIEGVTLLQGFQPTYVLGLMKFLYDNGSWGFGGGGSVSGIILAIFWIAEILMIYIAAFFISNSVADDLPFCETCNRWTEWTRGMHSVKADGKEALWQQVKLGDLNPIFELKPASDTDNLFVRFDAATCASCGQTAFLSIYRVELKYDKDGDVDKNEEPIVRHLLIDDSHIIKLMEANQQAIDHFDGDADEQDGDLADLISEQQIEKDRGTSRWNRS